jgi:hypothetical protein
MGKTSTNLEISSKAMFDYQRLTAVWVSFFRSSNWVCRRQMSPYWANGVPETSDVTWRRDHKGTRASPAGNSGQNKAQRNKAWAKDAGSKTTLSTNACYSVIAQLKQSSCILVISEQQFEAETKRASLGYAKFMPWSAWRDCSWGRFRRILAECWEDFLPMNTWKPSASASGRDENLFSASKVATTHQ